MQGQEAALLCSHTVACLIQVRCCAGGSTLRGLVDALLSNLRKAQRLSTGKPAGRASSSKELAPDWQLQAGSIVVVTTEVLFGASPAWQPGPKPAAAESKESAAEDGKHLEELEALVILVEEQWVREPLWGVPTSEDHSWHQDDSMAQRLTPQACCRSSSPPPLASYLLISLSQA